MIEETIRDALLAHAPLVSLVAERVYPVLMPQAVQYPCLVYQVISRVSEQHFQGRAGLDSVRAQMDCYGTSYVAAASVRDAVVVALDGRGGTFGSPGAVLQAAFLEGETGVFDATQAVGYPTPIYRIGVDFRLWINT